MVLPFEDQHGRKIAIKSYPFCPKCKKRMEDRVARSTFVKTFLFWIPLKRYKCYSCNRKRYVLN